MSNMMKLGKTATSAPNGISPTPAPIAVAIPVPPYFPHGVLTICPNNSMPMLTAETQLGYPIKTIGKVDIDPFIISMKNTAIPNFGDISE